MRSDSAVVRGAQPDNKDSVSQRFQLRHVLWQPKFLCEGQLIELKETAQQALTSGLAISQKKQSKFRIS